MGDSKSLVNLGELATPVNALIEKVADAVGGAFRPQHMRRIARAEVDVEIIKAKGAIELSDLQQRAIERFVGEEAQKQANIEAITDKALPQVDAEASPEAIGRDWLTHFFDKGRLISEQDVQMLWSRLLASEANKPGKFSKLTINVLASLDRTDAELFAKLYSFAVRIDPLSTVLAKEYQVPLIYNVQDSIYQDNGINFDSLIHLETLGLVNTSLGLSGYAEINVYKKGFVTYFNQQLYVELLDIPEPSFDLGGVLFTQAGMQLGTLVTAVPIEGFDRFLRETWKANGYKTEQ
jgi:hypothetical protein